MSKNILKELPELVTAAVIDETTAIRIKNYYQHKSEQGHNRLFIAFGILGAALTGLGIILIIAHNWDEISRTSKTILSFIPLITGQLLCGFTLLKKPANVAWKEGTSVFLFLAVGASIALISQIYNMHGELNSFLLIWMLLCLPLIYITQSSLSSLLYIIGITVRGCNSGYWIYNHAYDPYSFWLLFILILPHYYLLFKKNPLGNFMVFHNWLIPLSVIIMLGTIGKSHENLMFIVYMSLFGCFNLIGNTPFFKKQLPRNYGYIFLGSLGTIVLLLLLSFESCWQKIYAGKYNFNETLASPVLWVSILLTFVAITLLLLKKKKLIEYKIKPLEIIFIAFIPVYIIGYFFPLPATIIINAFVLLLGILTINEGADKDHLGVLNYGLLIITALVTLKFFDTDIRFVIRGILFLLVGIGFFLLNYKMLKKRKA